MEGLAAKEFPSTYLCCRLAALYLLRSINSCTVRKVTTHSDARTPEHAQAGLVTPQRQAGAPGPSSKNARQTTTCVSIIAFTNPGSRARELGAFMAVPRARVSTVVTALERPQTRTLKRNVSLHVCICIAAYSARARHTHARAHTHTHTHSDEA